MKKHLILKAFVLLVVMFFHSFVLVPKIYATVTGQSAKIIRELCRAVPPSTLIEQIIANTEKAALIGWRLASGVGIAYMLYEYGALDAVKTWLNTYGVNPTNNPTTAVNPAYTQYTGTNGWSFRVGINGSNYIMYAYKVGGAGMPIDTQGQWVMLSNSYTWAQCVSNMNYYGPPANNPPPTVVTDYGLSPGGSVSIPNGTVYGSPGAAAALTGGEAVQSVTLNLTQSEADALKNALGLTSINPSTGVQAGSPATTDNTVTAGDTASIGLLQQIATYVSNLIGIKEDTRAIKLNTDNLVAGQSSQTTAINNMKGTMDCVAIAINNQTAIDNAILGKVDNVTQFLNQSSASESSISTRIDALKTAAATKFPFSFVSSISLSPVTGSATYAFTSLTLAPGIDVPIDPLAGPMGDFFVWVRSILVWLIWSGTIFCMLKKIMEF